jgi:coenzyme F420-reducing hydrogenase gamma subunit
MLVISIEVSWIQIPAYLSSKRSRQAHKTVQAVERDSVLRVSNLPGHHILPRDRACALCIYLSVREHMCEAHLPSDAIEPAGPAGSKPRVIFATSCFMSVRTRFSETPSFVAAAGGTDATVRL